MFNIYLKKKTEENHSLKHSKSSKSNETQERTNKHMIEHQLPLSMGGGASISESMNRIVLTKN